MSAALPQDAGGSTATAAVVRADQIVTPAGDAGPIVMRVVSTVVDAMDSTAVAVDPTVGAVLVPVARSAVVTTAAIAAVSIGTPVVVRIVGRVVSSVVVRIVGRVVSSVVVRIVGRVVSSAVVPSVAGAGSSATIAGAVSIGRRIGRGRIGGARPPVDSVRGVAVPWRDVRCPNVWPGAVTAVR
ncbi:hypothetical protein DFR76_11835 [Nocardia pseudobrasiliensis]|uniref:Uncharacterized protein n=2 Tax=Nocardia pseudobrasiliensis TaxID=45979 RepID=A0A370HRT6_9NOCA|nr:hypothetical protein DFR76_11835 [Nocardia pseudobrasiliensis]